MILSARAIQDEFAGGRLRIDPSPDAVVGHDTDSVNVHMGDRLYEWRPRPGGMVTSLRLLFSRSSRIQIAVRDKSRLLGVFRPTL